MFNVFLSTTSSSIIMTCHWKFREVLLTDLNFIFVLDLVRSLFVVTVLFISGSVILFRGFYMSHEVFLVRFIFLVLLFVISIVVFILFPNFVCLMVGWDGLGVVSFLLVVYYINRESLSAGIITAISNRVGDVFFILLIGVLMCSLEFNFFTNFL